MPQFMVNSLQYVKKILARQQIVNKNKRQWHQRYANNCIKKHAFSILHKYDEFNTCKQRRKTTNAKENIENKYFSTKRTTKIQQRIKAIECFQP